MSESSFYKCIIKAEYEDDKGKTKYRKEEYLVNGVSPTDVEAQIAKKLSGGGDYEIISIVRTNILDVIYQTSKMNK